ncbi:MAG: hypothetical protein N0E48_27825, partial [Candidatus Thiodiazotropha endolucinida]|nr:hypothetical protein [Candidatus Thiodiazotropha taylori]MCW4347130.1 hypothetical protein [Candidatus Thiodiazotropha endolucinida]
DFNICTRGRSYKENIEKSLKINEQFQSFTLGQSLSFNIDNLGKSYLQGPGKQLISTCNMSKAGVSKSPNSVDSNTSGRITHTGDVAVKTPVGRLKAAYEHWRTAGASDQVLDIISNGYKLPFKDLPEPVLLPNNKSARDNPNFVSNEIQALIEKGCVSEVSDIPLVVNPLTVAYNKVGKPRLVLDCRHINPHLFKYKCCFENHSVARGLFEMGDFLFTFDLKSAYHHVMIMESLRTFLLLLRRAAEST